MQQKIKILDHHEAIKIAAGEVVERPAHIVKELIENSIDAGAQNISLHLQAAGKDLIKITDDGCGMSPDDAKLCFAHHATSKISTVNDLTSIATYGFRGEALSSIASVSHVELITKTEPDKLATQIKLEFGQPATHTQTSHPIGTTLIITKLFDNIPARKKFLKTDDTEWNLIVTIFQAFCLRYPALNFKLFHNDYLAYNCPATTQVKIRCAQLWSNQLHEQLLEIPNTTEQKITVSGAISNMHYHRFNRGQIFTFVNNRWVKNHELSKAILKGYDGVLPAQKFPAAFLFIDIDPTIIDINIHPKKEEVKFLHPGIVQRVVQDCVKQCLNGAVEQTLRPLHPFHPSIHFASQNTQYEPEKETDPTWSKLQRPLEMNEIEPAKNYPVEPSVLQPCPPKLLSEVKKQEPILRPQTQLTTPSTNTTIYEETPYSIIGQFKKTYIMIEKSEQMVIIDQHAAHERIIYERLKANNANVARVQLLFPHIVKLTTAQVAQLQTYQSLFEQHGILFESFSDCEIIIQATPIQISAPAVQEIMRVVLTWIEQHQQLKAHDLFAQLYEKILAEKACKAACKAGDTLNVEQMQSLIKELQKTSNNFCCPHGRPTMWNMQLKDIEKHFKRDYASAKQHTDDFF